MTASTHQPDDLYCANCKWTGRAGDALQVSDGEPVCPECLSRNVEELPEEPETKQLPNFGVMTRIGLTMLLWFALGIAFALPWLFDNDEIAENAINFWRNF